MPQFGLLFYAILQSCRPKGGGPWHNAPPLNTPLKLTLILRKSNSILLFCTIFAFSYFYAFFYFSTVGKSGNRAKRPLGIRLGLG